MTCNPANFLHRRLSSGLPAAAVVILLSMSNFATAWQDTAVSAIPADDSVSLEQLESALQSVEARQDLDDEIRARVIEQLRDAQAQVNNRLAAEQAASTYAAAIESAPLETASLRASLDEEIATPTAQSLGIDESTTLAELEPALAREAAELAAIDARLAELESRIETESGRPVAARDRITELRASSEALAEASQAPPPPDEQQILTDARVLASNLRRRAQLAEIARLEQEILSHTVRLDRTRAQRDVAARSKANVERRVEVFRAQANVQRQAAAVSAQEAAAAAELAAADKHPAIRALAEGNAELTQEMPAVAAEIERVGGDLDAVESEVQSIEQRMARSRQRLEVGGLSRVTGRLLIDDQRKLPQVSQYRTEVRARRSTLAEIGLAQVRIQEQQRELTPVDRYVDQTMELVAEDVDSDEELSSIRAEVRSLLRDRRSLLDQTDNTYRSYLQALSDLDVAQRRLLESAADYKEFLDQHLMWIPSAPIIGTGTWRDVGPAAAWALSPTSWLATVAATMESFGERVVSGFLIAIILVTLVISRRPLAKQYRSMNSRIGRLSEDNIGLTLGALAIATVHVLPLPLLLAVIGLFLQHAPQQSSFSLAVAAGLLAVAPFLYNVLLFRLLAAADGVMRVHFGWREEGLAAIRAQLNRLIVIGMPLVFTTIMLYSSEIASDRATLGRLAFVTLMVTLTMVMHPLAHPEKGVASNHYHRTPKNWDTRLRRLWYALATVGPLLLALLAMLGYIYTSATLTGLLVDTIWLALGMILINLVVLRWLALARRKIAWQLAIKEREAKKADKEKQTEEEGEGELPVVASKPLDLDAVDQQTRKLLQSGLFLIAIIAGWAIWAEVLPAFNLLDQVSLWSKTVTVDAVETIVPVTLADLLLGLVVAAVTAIASKNLPGLMEIAVLQRFTLQPGSRYAINTLVRYVVVTIGVIVVMNIIGWNWGRIQWLVAALSVGLGFGLQEIVANFVSGLVILFERPVRVGDTVTVGQLTGSVTKVRIRATTITDWDRKEIIVPNKSFITEQVINWTLSDPITRVVVPVGISYGSDVELAHRVMSETLRALPLVLDEPEPKVYFMGFGESSLDFKLYVYSRQLADRLPLMHAVHEAILSALREHNIEIPFPQRDLHVRSTVEKSSVEQEQRQERELGPRRAGRPAK